MITVFTSCYNQANHLKKAIESVLSQTYTDFEYLLYDDGSTDETWEIIQSYAKKDKRIRAFKLEKMPNVGVVINKSIKDAKGDVWTWCPSDDLFLPNLLEVKSRYQEKYPDSILYHNWHIINENDQPRGSYKVRELSPEKFNKVVWNESPIGFTGIWIPMKVFGVVGEFPEHLQYSEDFYWMIKATIHQVPFVGIPEYLHKKRKHFNTLTSKNIDKIIKQIPKIRKDLKDYRERLTNDKS